jgi:transposase
METHRRKADGRRVFTPQFKQEQVARLGRQELTVSELARELVVAPQLIKQWQRLSSDGSTAAVTANEDIVPASELRAAEQRARELERALGKRSWRSRSSRRRVTK